MKSDTNSQLKRVDENISIFTHFFLFKDANYGVISAYENEFFVKSRLYFPISNRLISRVFFIYP